MQDEKDDVLERALAIANKRQPDASQQHKAAFANAVQYAVTGWSGGYGGPSVREHAAARVCPPKMTFDAAVETLIAADGVIFGPLTELHMICWASEHCFDDDPADVALLQTS